MKAISNILSKKKKNKNCALIPFVTAGYPNLNITTDILRLLDLKGADAIEVGIPYADALADGPIIQHSSKIALLNGVYIDQVLSLLNNLIPNIKCPIIIFSYYNPILVKGVNSFIKDISCCGVKGLVIPDLPIEETDYMIYLCDLFSIELILFIAPTSSTIRINNILSKSPGCLYVVSSTGVTGLRKDIDNKIKLLCNYVKVNSNKSIILGFGISDSLQAYKVSRWNIEGIVMGSAFIKILSDYSNLNNFNSNTLLLEKIGNFCTEIKSSITS